jgi:hypothetical protein
LCLQRFGGPLRLFMAPTTGSPFAWPIAAAASVLSGLHGVGDQRKQPAQFDSARRRCGSLRLIPRRRRTSPEHGNADHNRQAPNGRDLAAILRPADRLKKMLEAIQRDAEWPQGSIPPPASPMADTAPTSQGYRGARQPAAELTPPHAVSSVSLRSIDRRSRRHRKPPIRL